MGMKIGLGVCTSPKKLRLKEVRSLQNWIFTQPPCNLKGDFTFSIPTPEKLNCTSDGCENYQNGDCLWYSWRIRDQLDVTSYYVLFHFFYAQHVSDINTSIIRSLRLFCCTITLVVCCCFDMCWSFGVAGLGWYPCGRLKHNCASACYTDTTPTQPHRNSNTHRNKNTQPMWWYNSKVACSWWWVY